MDVGFTPAGVEWEFRAGHVGNFVRMQVFTALGGGAHGGTGLPSGCMLRVIWRGYHGGLRTLVAEVSKAADEAVVVLEDGSDRAARIVRAPDLEFDYVFVAVDDSDLIAVRVTNVDGSTCSENIQAPA